MGVKILWPGHLDPHPRLLFLKLKEFQLCVQEMLRYFLIKLFPNITTLFHRYTYMFHCMSGIEGGGEDTVP